MEARYTQGGFSYGNRPLGTHHPPSEDRPAGHLPCTRPDPQDALETACHQLDLPKPIWLDKNQREWDEFGQTRFLPDAFFESVPFQRMEIEYIDPDAKKKKSTDYRNAF